MLEVAKFLTKSNKNITPFVSELLDGNKYIETSFDQIISDALDKIITGEIKNLIINIPPGSGKTLRAVWSFVARGFAINPSSRFLHASYSDVLVKDNSTKIRDIVTSHDYHALFPYVDLKQDTKSKGLWNTSRKGAFLASPSGGSITGFRAGVVNSKIFSGALIIDDPLKPSDALSDTKLSFINERWKNTFRSRRADRNTPTIVIMQRVHEFDFTWYLLNMSGEEWHHLVLPVYVDNENYVYDQNGIEIKHNLPDGSLWGIKWTDTEAQNLMVDGQYSQNPKPLKGEIFEREWFLKYDTLPPIKEFCIFADTASKINKWNDYSVFQLWGVGFNNKGYLIDQFRDKVKVPHLKDAFMKFYNKAIISHDQKKIEIYIEDKDSGVGLIQALEEEKKYSVNAIQRNINKLSRAVESAPKIKDGFIFVPSNKSFTSGYISEFIKFKNDDSHAFDDQIDPTMDFISNKIIGKIRKIGSAGVGRRVL